MSGKRKGNYFPIYIMNHANTAAPNNMLITITKVKSSLLIIINLFIIITYEWRRTMLYIYLVCVLAC